MKLLAHGHTPPTLPDDVVGRLQSLGDRLA
jgi:hypothetical protein